MFTFNPSMRNESPITYEGPLQKFSFENGRVVVLDKRGNFIIKTSLIRFPRITPSNASMTKKVKWLFKRGCYPLLTSNGIIFKTGLKGGGATTSKVAKSDMLSEEEMGISEENLETIPLHESEDSNTPSTSEPSSGSHIDDQIIPSSFKPYRHHQSFQIHDNPAKSICIKRDGTIATSTKKEVVIWSLPNGQIIKKIKSGPTLDHVHESSQRYLILGSHQSKKKKELIGSESCFVEIWDPELKQATILKTHTAYYNSPKVLAITELPSPQIDAKTRLSNDNHKVRVKARTYDDQFVVNLVDFQLDRFSFAAIHTQNSEIKLWNVRENEFEISLKGHEDNITAICLLKNRLLVSVSNDKTLNLWDLKTQKVVFTYACKHSNIIHLFEWENKIIGISADGYVEAWDLHEHEKSLPSDRVLRELLKIESISCVQMSKAHLRFALPLSDETLLTINFRGVVEIWDVKKITCLQRLEDKKYLSAAEISKGKIILGDSKGCISLFSSIEPKEKTELDSSADSTSSSMSLEEDTTRLNENNEDLSTDETISSEPDEEFEKSFAQLATENAILQMEETKKFQTLKLAKTQTVPQEIIKSVVDEEIESLAERVKEEKQVQDGLETWQIIQNEAYQRTLQQENEHQDKIQQLEMRIEKLSESTPLREKMALIKQLTHERDSNRKIQQLKEEQKQQQAFVLELKNLYANEFSTLKKQYEELTDNEKDLKQKVEPLYAKYERKEEIKKERSKLESSKKTAVFYRTLRDELNKKLQASILLSSGLLQRASVKKDLLADGADFAAQSVCVIIAGMISVGTFGASTLVVGAAAAVGGAVAGKAASELVSSRIDKKYEGRAHEISLALGNTKHAAVVAELIARNITKHYMVILENESKHKNQKWAQNAAQSIYLFLAQGKLKKENCQTEQDVIDVLIKAAEDELEKGRMDKKNKCSIL